MSPPRSSSFTTPCAPAACTGPSPRGRGDGAVADGEADLRHAAVHLPPPRLLAARADAPRQAGAVADREAPVLRPLHPRQHRRVGRTAGDPEPQLDLARPDRSARP